MDEALALPSNNSSELALRIQQILAYETDITNVVDPFAGSYYIESLTNQMEKEVMEIIDKVDSLGGAIEAIGLDFQQKEIAQSSYKYQKNIDKKEKIIIGVNDFISNEKVKNELQTIDYNETQNQIQQLKKYKKNRNKKTTISSLMELDNIIKVGKNVIPGILQALKAKSTLGEISDIFRKNYGEYS